MLLSPVTWNTKNSITPTQPKIHKRIMAAGTIPLLFWIRPEITPKAAQ